MLVGMVGINHKQASLRERELLAKTCQRRFTPFVTLPDKPPIILLSTCNRTEIYFSSPNLAETHSTILHLLRNEVSEEIAQQLYSFFGIDCFYHLSKVTAGLDSAIIWETEIQGQVKAAYEKTSQNQSLPKELHFLFQKALKNGKLVRSKLQAGRGVPAIEHALFHLAMDYLSDPFDANILIVGASDINKKILHFLQGKGFSRLTICNRTDQKADQIAKTSSISWLEWNRSADWHRFDWLIFGTKSPQYLIHYHNIQHHTNIQLLTDLSVPRNVDPLIETHSSLTVHNIDQIHRLLSNSRQKMQHLVVRGEELLKQAISWQVCKKSVDSVEIRKEIQAVY